MSAWDGFLIAAACYAGLIVLVLAFFRGAAGHDEPRP